MNPLSLLQLFETNYKTDYELCGMVFLFVVFYFNIKSKRQKALSSRLFSLITVISVITVLLDIITAYTIPNTDIIPDFLNYILLIMLFSMQNILPIILICYILCLAEKNIIKNRTKLILLSVPFIISEILLFTTPFLHLAFKFDNGIYSHTSGFLFIYFTNFFYLIVSCIEMILLKKCFQHTRINAMFAFALLNFIAALLQFLFPDYLLIGTAISLSITIFYITLQNPKGYIDELTGLFNRTSFIHYMNELHSMEQTKYITFIALDGMKTINNTYSNSVGSNLIGRFALYLESLGHGEAYRLVGDQFAICSNTEDDAKQISVTINSRMRRSWTISSFGITLSACVCYGMCFGADVSVSDLMTISERAMSNAKNKGKGTIIKIDDKIIAETKRELEIESALRKAVKENSIEVYYQPIYSLKKKRFTGAEALARFNHPKLGNISPALFIPLAEKNGLIIELGAQILRKVCNFIHSSGMIENKLLQFIDYNLSPIELLSENLPDTLKTTLSRYNLEKALHFEITETAATLTFDKASKNIIMLSNDGMHFSIDDYGSGYANLDIVLSLPFSAVKIDRSLVLSAMDNPKARTMLECTYDTLKRLGMTIITEGVETEEQLKLVSEIGTDCIQGFYFAKPMPEQVFSEFITNQGGC